MSSTQIVSIIAIYILLLIIPALFIYWLGFKTNKSKINLLLKLLSVWSYFIFFFYAGTWQFVSYYFRYILLFLLIGATIKALLPFKTLVLFEKKKVWGWTKFVGQVLFAVIFVMSCIQLIPGFSTDEKGINISFPLKEAYIWHGGNLEALNYHQADTSAQHYALDIGKLNKWGLRADGFFPDDLNKYAIYGDTVFAPCDAKVVRVRDSLDNAKIGEEIKVKITGNHIVLEYENCLIVFCHLFKNSLLVSVGDTVRKGQPMARVGNSGHTSEPHLHIHAIAGTDTSKILTGHGIPIYFDGKFLIRNDRIKQ